MTLRSLALHTVCEEARCPNIAECFSRDTATFMILGDVCTRNCAFCGCQKGKPAAVEAAEPANVARAARKLNLRHCVVTSVTRDDLNDGGASQFVSTMQAIREANRCTTVEVLTPDFRGDVAAAKAVFAAKPDVFNHNVETVPRLYPSVRPGADYERSLRLLHLAKETDPGAVTKSGLMIGLSETLLEVEDVLKDLASIGLSAVTIGQYMQPSRNNTPVSKYYEPAFFTELVERGRALGIKHVLAGPLVRSSYNAKELLDMMHSNYS